MKADMRRRLEEATDDKMFDEGWAEENDTKVLPPGPGTDVFGSEPSL